MTAFSNLRYERWVKERREHGRQALRRPGRLPAHQGDGSTLAGEVQERARPSSATRKGLVIDERWNGGGNIEQELLAILVQRPYEVWQPRGVEPTERPFTGYFGPKVVLQNWRSASNAEMFPAGFRALGLGKVVGTPTMGAVIGTGSYSLIDGSSIRTPGRRRLPRRHGPDQHGKPRRPARRLRREHPRGQPRRPRPPARSGRPRSHERPQAERVGRQERQGVKKGDKSNGMRIRINSCRRRGLSEMKTDDLPKLVVNPARPGRFGPRVRKRRPKQYPLMKIPRSEIRKRLLEQPVAAYLHAIHTIAVFSS